MEQLAGETATAGASSRLAGLLIDGLNALRPGAYLSYPALSILVSASTLLGTWLLWHAVSARSRSHGSV